VKTWFQAFACFKCNLYRYTAHRTLHHFCAEIVDVVGLYKLNPVDP
jgi:hypothetical protein